jgi:hypothetical protein
MRNLTIDLSIDWIAIWHFLSLDSSSLVTSFTSTRLKTFIFKNFMGEMPVLERMIQVLPDLYKDWNCASCNNDLETINHVWQCSVHKPYITSIINSTKALLNKLLVEYSISSTLLFDLNTVFDQTFEISSDTGLIQVMKALIPCSLVSVIHKIT